VLVRKLMKSANPPIHAAPQPIAVIDQGRECQIAAVGTPGYHHALGS